MEEDNDNELKLLSLSNGDFRRVLLQTSVATSASLSNSSTMSPDSRRISTGGVGCGALIACALPIPHVSLDTDKIDSASSPCNTFGTRESSMLHADPITPRQSSHKKRRMPRHFDLVDCRTACDPKHPTKPRRKVMKDMPVLNQIVARLCLAWVFCHQATITSFEHKTCKI